MKIIECPRDAMQAVATFIDTQTKIHYLNKLLEVGFDTLDFGSFVSPAVVPQMRDTAAVLAGLDLSVGKTKLMTLVANLRGAQQAADFEQIGYLAFPLSLSESFQLKNTNQTISEAFAELARVQELCGKSNKTLVTYLSMSFGNPYGEPYSTEIVEDFTEKLAKMGATIICLSDSTGSSTTDEIKALFGALTARFPAIEFGAHLHAKYGHTAKKTKAAYKSGVRRIDCALRGFGGCPMPAEKLIGNLATELVVSELRKLGANVSLDDTKLAVAMLQSQYIFE